MDRRWYRAVIYETKVRDHKATQTLITEAETRFVHSQRNSRLPFVDWLAIVTIAIGVPPLQSPASASDIEASQVQGIVGEGGREIPPLDFWPDALHRGHSIPRNHSA
jgi:hypothetical protein